MEREACSRRFRACARAFRRSLRRAQALRHRASRSLAFGFVFFTNAPAQQLAVPRLELLPERPSPYRLRDWRKTALDFDRLVFDADAQGPYLPLSWRVPSVPNLDVPGFGMPSYVGKEDARGRPAEAIAALGALLGATAVGLDKGRWVELMPQYLAPEGTILNNVGGASGGSFWYELLPSVVFTQLASRYPDWARGDRISTGIADAWVRGLDALKGDFDHTSLDFRALKPVDNGRWKEPEAAAAVAYLELFQALRKREPRYLAAARSALGALQRRADNPTYEVLLPYGALAAACLNAERGDRWDVPRFLDWCLEPTSPYRTGWGMVGGRWGGLDVGGLMGSTTDGGGYAFAMNTTLSVATLLPLARYDDRFSAALAKWALNAANASRLLYRDGLPAENQSGAAWKGDPRASVAYEGLRRTWRGRTPYASGDAKAAGWAREDFGLYGGGYVGLLGALVHPTNVPMVLRLDLRATDFLPVRAYPTDLFWNPHPVPKTVRLDLGPRPVRLYDAVANRFLAPKPVKGLFPLRLPPEGAAQIVEAPPTGPVAYAGDRTLVGGVPIDYHNGRVPLPPRRAARRPDESAAVRVGREWSQGEPLPLAVGAFRADLRFRWDERSLHFRLEQRAPATETVEAPSAPELKRHWWDFEAVVLTLDPGHGAFATVGDAEAIFGWSSVGARGLYASALPMAVRTAGTARTADRTIEGTIGWEDLRRACGVRRPWKGFVRAGAMIGCQPLVVDGTFRRQAYVGGAQYARPSGFDRNSRTLVLVGGPDAAPRLPQPRRGDPLKRRAPALVRETNPVPQP